MKESFIARIPLSSLTGKPPKPRQSRSPAARSGAYSITSEDPESGIPCRFGGHSDDPAALSKLVHPIESTRDDDNNNFGVLEESFGDLTTVIDSSQDIPRSKSRTNELPFCETDGSHVHKWDPVCTNRGIMPNHPFLIPSHLLSYTSGPVKGSQGSPFSDPSLDILAQWRLRRKLEMAVEQSSLPNCSIGTATHTSLLPNYSPCHSGWLGRCQLSNRPSMCEWADSLTTMPNPPWCPVSSNPDSETHKPVSCRFLAATTQTEHPLEIRMHDVATMTTRSSRLIHCGCTADLKPSGRSVRVMVFPSCAVAETQTPWSWHSGEIEKNQPADVIETAAVSDTDSWQWTQVSSDFPPSPQHSPCGTLASTPVLHAHGHPSVHGIQHNGASADDLSFGIRIMRYLDQPNDVCRLTDQWKDDTMIKDLLSRRSACLDRLTSVILELRRRELDLVTKARFAQSLT